MKRLVLSCFGLLAFLPLAPCSGEDAPYRIWTNQGGEQIEAKLVSAEEDTISILKRDGRLYRDLELSLFSKADVEWVRQFQAGQAAAAEAAANQPRVESTLVSPGKLLFEDPFASLDASWKTPHGHWTVAEGVLTAMELPENQHAAVCKRALPLTNAIVEYDVKLSPETNQTAFGFDDHDHICRLQILPDAFLVRKDDHDHEGPDTGVLLERKELEVDPEDWFTVHMELIGPHFLVQIDDEVAYGFHALIASEKRKWGFVVGGGPVQFRNLRVWEASVGPDYEDAVARLERGRS